MLEAVVGPTSLQLASQLSNLAYVLAHLRRPREALVLQHRHLAALEGLLVPGHTRCDRT